jgi:hypothetical protein
MELKLVSIGEDMPIGDSESAKAVMQNTLELRPPASPRDKIRRANRALAGGHQPLAICGRGLRRDVNANTELGDAQFGVVGDERRDEIVSKRSNNGHERDRLTSAVTRTLVVILTSS